jgi:hypothetical protein
MQTSVASKHSAVAGIWPLGKLRRHLASAARGPPQAQIEVIFDGRVNEVFINCNTPA